MKGLIDSSEETTPQEKKRWLRTSWTKTNDDDDDDDDDATIDGIATTNDAKREDEKRAQLRSAGRLWIVVLAGTALVLHGFCSDCHWYSLIPATTRRMAQAATTPEKIGETAILMVETDHGENGVAKGGQDGRGGASGDDR